MPGRQRADSALRSDPPGVHDARTGGCAACRLVWLRASSRVGIGFSRLGTGEGGSQSGSAAGYSKPIMTVKATLTHSHTHTLTADPPGVARFMDRDAIAFDGWPFIRRRCSSVSRLPTVGGRRPWTRGRRNRLTGRHLRLTGPGRVSFASRRLRRWGAPGVPKAVAGTPSVRRRRGAYPTHGERRQARGGPGAPGPRPGGSVRHIVSFGARRIRRRDRRRPGAAVADGDQPPAWLWATAAAGTAGMVWSRTYLQAHWLSDAVTGALLGVGVSLAVFAVIGPSRYPSLRPGSRGTPSTAKP